MIRKTINGGDFKSQMVGELVFDQVPEEGSFNPVTSDGVAKAIDKAKDDMQEKIDEVTLDPSAVALGNVHLLDEVTEFPADGCILVDSETNGPGEMSKDTLLELTAQNALAGNAAPAFDPTRTSDKPYLVDEVVINDGKQYLCVYPHYGAWDASHFVEKPVSGIYPNGTDIEIQHPDDSSFVKIIHGSDLIKGRVGSSGWVDAPNMACTKNFIPVKNGDCVVYTYDGSNSGIQVRIVVYDKNKDHPVFEDWTTASTTGGTKNNSYTVSEDGFIKIIYTNGQPITDSIIQNFDSSVIIVRLGLSRFFSNSVVEKIRPLCKENKLVLTSDFFEQGYWTYDSTLQIEKKSDSLYRSRNAIPLRVSKNDIIAVTDDTFEFVGVVFPFDGTERQVADAALGMAVNKSGLLYLTVRPKGAAQTNPLTPSDADGKVVIYHNEDEISVYSNKKHDLRFGLISGGSNAQRFTNYKPLICNKGDILYVNHDKLQVNFVEINRTTLSEISQSGYIAGTYKTTDSGVKIGYYVVQNDDVIVRYLGCPVYGYTLTGDIGDYVDSVVLVRKSSEIYDFEKFNRVTPKSSRKGRTIAFESYLMQDGCFVGDDLWISEENSGSNPGTIKVVNAKTGELKKTITHDFGHNGICDYCEETDTMLNVIPGDDYIYLLSGVADVAASISADDCVKIDLTDTLGILASGRSGCFGENKQTLYIGTGDLTTTQSAPNKIYKLWLEMADGQYTGNVSLIGTYTINAVCNQVCGVYADYVANSLGSMQSMKYDGYMYIAYGTKGHNFIVCDLDDKTMTWSIVGRIAYEYFTPAHVKKFLEPEFVALRNGKIVCGSRHLDTNNHANDVSSIVEFDKW